MNQPLFGSNQQSPILRQLLAQQLQQQSKPIVSPLQGVAEVGSQLAKAYTAKKMDERERGERINRSKALAQALTGQVEGPMPAGQFGPGAPQAPTTQQIMARLLENPDTADYGAQMMFGNIQNQQALDNEIAKRKALQPFELELAREKARIGQQYGSGSVAPSSVREYEYFNSLSPEEQKRYLNMKRATLDKGVVYDEYGNAVPVGGYVESVSEIEGGKAGAKQQAEKDVDLEMNPQIAAAEKQATMQAEGEFNFPKVTASFNASMDKTANLLDRIDKVSEQANGWTTGVGGAMTKWVPGSPAFDLAQNLKTIIANAAFDELQEMRDNSPTGGALGQVSERELELLQAARTALEQAQGPTQFAENLQAYRNQVEQSKKRLQQAYQSDLARFGPEAMQGVNVPSTPQTISLEEFLNEGN